MLGLPACCSRDGDELGMQLALSRSFLSSADLRAAFLQMSSIKH